MTQMISRTLEDYIVKCRGGVRSTLLCRANSKDERCLLTAISSYFLESKLDDQRSLAHFPILCARYVEFGGSLEIEFCKFEFGGLSQNHPGGDVTPERQLSHKIQCLVQMFCKIYDIKLVRFPIIFHMVQNEIETEFVMRNASCI